MCSLEWYTSARRAFIAQKNTHALSHGSFYMSCYNSSTFKTSAACWEITGICPQDLNSMIPLLPSHQSIHFHRMSSIHSRGFYLIPQSHIFLLHVDTDIDFCSKINVTMLGSSKSGHILEKLYWHWIDTWENPVLFTLLKENVTQEDWENVVCNHNSHYSLLLYRIFSITSLTFMPLYTLVTFLKVQERLKC